MKSKINNFLKFGTVAIFLLGMVSMASAQDHTQGFDLSVSTADNMEPAIPHPDQLKAAEAKIKALEKKTGKKPNILWIVVDDMGYGDPGCYGGGIAIGAPTPNIDSLARGGLRLTSCYSQQTCTPTRSAILTGRLPVRTGLTRPILAGDKLTKNPWDGEVSLPTLLGVAGYQTLLVGKWHVGEPVGMRPQDIGFDEFYGFYPAQKEITQRYDARRYPALVLDKQRMDAFELIAPDDHLQHGFKNGKTTAEWQVKSTGDMGRVDQKLTDFTIQKIKDYAKSGKPFFLEHCFMKVHCDNFDNPDYPGLSPAKYAYRNAVAEVDMHVGAIMQTLREEGLLENTLVFFTSDNGPQMDGWPDSGYTPFRGAKGTTFEGGVRVPGIVYWKGMIEPGRESDGLFDLMDLYGTALNLAGISADKLPADKYYDFVDQTSFLLNDDGISNREAVYFWWGNQFMGCREKEFKVHFKVVLPETTHMQIDMSTIQNVGLAPWFFNLYISPKEDMTVGHRRSPWLASVVGKAKAHQATFKKFPPKDVGLGM